MQSYLLSIGDELVSGLTTNTNSAWLALQLTAIGINPIAHVTVGDDLTAIVSAIKHALEVLEDNAPHIASGLPGAAHPTLKNPADPHGGILLISGGLGPTEDDLTRQALAIALDESLVEDPDAVLQLENWFKSRNRPMALSNRTQALRPTSATCIENASGTAPGLHALRGETQIIVLPGVPHEMKDMFSRSVLPDLREKAAGVVTLTSKLNTCGIGESALGEKIRDLMARGANPSVGTTVHEGIVSVRIYASAEEPAARAMTDNIKKIVRDRLGPLVFGEDDQTLPQALAEILTAQRRTLATAESCTGGLLGKLLTDIPGSSAWFLRGWITYSNAAKHEDLGVEPALIEKHGAVSEPVARAMAEGARKFAASDFALATTGIAGPGGGTHDKPVGAVWIALAGPDPGNGADATLARKFVFPGDREAIRLRAAQMAIALLRWNLLGAELP